MLDRRDTPLGQVPLVGAPLTSADLLGRVKVRLGIGRMHYTVVPGLYATGEPGPNSPILVTANFKLSFDLLRRELTGVSAWILALDTNGINVWCAAGKGSFGSANLIASLANLDLKQLVEHTELVLPQLGAPGIAAHEIKKATGFKVIYGPIRARDLPAFLRDRKATPAMRSKDFTLAERLELAPMELIPALKYALPFAIGLGLLFGLGQAAAGAWFAALAVLLTAAGASVLGPALLPWLPGRAFSLKGLYLGLAMTLVLVFGWGPGLRDPLASVGWFCFLPALASFLVMNFTGASTYTSLSGVKLEMRRAVPLQIVSAAVGLGLLIVARLA